MSRKPMPEALKLLKGTYQPCRAKPPLPKSEGFRKHPPRRLTAAQKSAWREIVAATPVGLLAPGDCFMVEIAACLLAEYREDPAAMNAARVAQLHATLKMLALNPYARQTLNIAAPSENEYDQFDDF